MNQVASQTEIGKICSEQSPCSASRLSRPADTLSGALSHGQDPFPATQLGVFGPDPILQRLGPPGTRPVCQYGLSPQIVTRWP